MPQPKQALKSFNWNKIPEAMIDQKSVWAHIDESTVRHTSLTELTGFLA